MDPEALLHKDLSKRDDKQFDYLRDLNSLKSRIGKEVGSSQFIALPHLGAFPKELKKEKIQKFFLTKERLEILEKVWKTVQMRLDNVEIADSIELNGKTLYLRSREFEGLIPSGPHGISKSSLVYFIASVAYANNCVVLYMV